MKWLGYRALLALPFWIAAAKLSNYAAWAFPKRSSGRAIALAIKLSIIARRLQGRM